MAMRGFATNCALGARFWEQPESRVPAALSQKIPSIGLALGGGFARGIVHIGVLKVLEAENIPIGFVAGTSVGALIGAAYCSGVSPAELEQIATRVRFRDLARWTVSRYGFATNLADAHFPEPGSEGEDLRRAPHSPCRHRHGSRIRRRRGLSLRTSC